MSKCRFDTGRDSKVKPGTVSFPTGEGRRYFSRFRPLMDHVRVTYVKAKPPTVYSVRREDASMNLAMRSNCARMLRAIIQIFGDVKRAGHHRVGLLAGDPYVITPGDRGVEVDARIESVERIIATTEAAVGCADNQRGVSRAGEIEAQCWEWPRCVIEREARRGGGKSRTIRPGAAYIDRPARADIGRERVGDETAADAGIAENRRLRGIEAG